MSFYARHIGPRFVSCLCSQDDIRREREKIVPLAEGDVLEIGIGPGLNLDLYDPDRVRRVVGVDPVEGFLALGAKRHLCSPVPLEIVRAPAERLPLDAGSIDTAVVTYTLCSVDDPLAALGEIRRVLKPGGRVLFLEHGLSPDQGVAKWQRWINPAWRKLAVGCNLTRPVTETLDRAAFRIASVDNFYFPGVPRPLGYLSRGIAMPG